MGEYGEEVSYLSDSLNMKRLTKKVSPFIHFQLPVTP